LSWYGWRLPEAPSRRVFLAEVPSSSGEPLSPAARLSPVLGPDEMPVYPEMGPDEGPGVAFRSDEPGIENCEMEGNKEKGKARPIKHVF
jgi:hypothetical protein